MSNAFDMLFSQFVASCCKERYSLLISNTDNLKIYKEGLLGNLHYIKISLKTGEINVEEWPLIIAKWL